MKIIALNGSHRGNKGFTQILIDQIKKGAVEAGAEFETILLSDYKINHCIGCETCHPKDKTDKNFLKCVYNDKDDMKLILDKMKTADMYIYATPSYIFNMSSVMKNFLERFYSTSDIDHFTVSKKGCFFHHIDEDLSKPIVVLSTYSSFENETIKNIHEYFKTYSKFMDAPIVGNLVRPTSALLKSMDEKEPPDIKKQIYIAYNNAGKELVSKGKVTRKTEKAVAKSVIPFASLIKLSFRIKPLSKIMLEMMDKNANQK